MKILITEEQYKLIKENSLKQTLIDQINLYGWDDTSSLVGGSGEVVKILDIKTPKDFLNLYELKMVTSPNRIDFLNKNDEILMVYVSERDELIIDFGKVYEPYVYLFQHTKNVDKIATIELKDTIKNWFEDKFNLNVKKIVPTYIVID